MRVAITGGSGLVGRFIVAGAVEAGHAVTLLARRPPPDGLLPAGLPVLPYDLTAPPPDLSGQEALVHCAFAHQPGKYRGGEGDDPDGFLAANRDGSLALFRAAKAAGLSAAVFLSTRAVYGDHPPGTLLTEDMPARPDTLYGRMKLEVEQGLAALSGDGFTGTSLRVTGVYGPGAPGQPHKWAGLFADYLAGRPVAPRVATEVHGEDVADAVLTVLDRRAGGLFNVSDLLLDRHDLLATVRWLTGSDHPLPPRAEADRVNVMDCTRLMALDWHPGGLTRLAAALPEMI
ncbi:NAD-dependent epimerase/dehydratase family protein [Frigidibacter oleivorans]|uniref:NAD-dependent epimerase/dehydratase family protein n=1 Tax=Frigidibacter oleivorans TaxID=2487129 RepID=UPI000F8E9CCB|nr:NAD(P)-dependent oxidoreductase [Frigidibacter oleivorans]